MPVCIGFPPVYAETHEICTLLCKPCPLSSSQTTQEEIFPGSSQAAKLNQFKPVFTSVKLMKSLKFPMFCINFTHFWFEFLKDFYIFRISGPSGSFWYQQLQDSSSINEEKYCSQEMVISTQFLLHNNLHISLINNIKIIFL